MMKEYEISSPLGVGLASAFSPEVFRSRVVADVPIGPPDPPLSLIDQENQLKLCFKRIKHCQLGEGIIITGSSQSLPHVEIPSPLNSRQSHGQNLRYSNSHSPQNHSQIGTGKTTFVSTLIRKQELRTLFSGGIYWINPGEITTEIEYISLFRKLAEEIVQYFVKYQIVPSIQSHKWYGILRPSHGDVRLEDCLQCLRELISIANQPVSNPSYHSISSSSQDRSQPQTRRILLVLNDLRTDYIPRLLRGCDVIFLITTRYPELFSEGQIKGSLFNLEICSIENRLALLHSSRGNHQISSSSFFSNNSNSISNLLQAIYETCPSWIEIDLMTRYLQGQTLDSYFLQGVLQQRRSELTPGCQSTRWITDHMNDHWKTISLIQHLGSFILFFLLFETLIPLTKQRYLGLSLLPSSVLFSRQFLMTYWNLKSEQEVDDLFDILCRKGLMNCITSEGNDGEVLKQYSLSLLHSHLLTLLVLREKQLENEENSILSSLFMCSIFVSTSSSISSSQTSYLSSSGRSIQSYLHTLSVSLINYLSDLRNLSIPVYRLAKHITYWRRLSLCSSAQILPSFTGPLKAFHEVIEKSSFEGDGMALFDYIFAATYLLEYLDIEPEEKVKQWLLTALQVLARVENSQHISSTHSTSIPLSNQCKRAVLMNKLGVLYRSEMKLKEGLDYHIAALNTFQSTRHPTGSPYHNEIAKTFIHIAEIYVVENALDDAITVIQSVLHFQQGSTSFDYPLTLASIWKQLGDVYSLQDKYEDSIQSYDTSIAIYQKTVGISHPDTILTEGMKGIILIKWSQFLSQTSSQSLPLPRVEIARNQPQKEKFEESTSPEASIGSSESNQSRSSHSPLALIQSKREEGIALAASAIAWFIRRGYSITTRKLQRILNSFPTEEKFLFNFMTRPAHTSSLSPSPTPSPHPGT